MIITALRVTSVKLPLKEVFQVSFRVVTDADVVLLELETDEGLIGVGEVVPLPRFNGQSVESVTAAIEQYMRPYIVGEDPFRMNRILDRAGRAVAGNMPALCAVDLALHDLVARALGRPVVDLLGGAVRDRVVAVIEMPIEDPERSAARALALVADGFKAFKPKVGRDPLDDAGRLAAIRGAVGEGVTLRVDVNQAWTVDQAIGFLRESERLGVGLELIEQPVPKWDLEGLARIRSRTDVPVMVDESVFTPQDAMRVIRAGAADIINIKQNKSGGLRGAMKIAAIAEAAGVEYLLGVDDPIGIGTAMKVHMACALEQLTRPCEFSEFAVFDDHLLERPFAVEDGHALLPEGPGFGVQIDWERAAAFRHHQGTARPESL